MRKGELDSAVKKLMSNLKITSLKKVVNGLKSDDAIYVSNFVLGEILIKTMNEDFKCDKNVVEFLRDTINKSNNELRDLATKDPLTKLHNRNELSRIFAQEQLRMRRWPPGYVFSILIMDIDFFKKFNDSYGHNAGDEVLKNFSRLITENIRGTDGAFRYGGEEFIIIYSGTSGREAFRAAKYLREYVNDFKMEFVDEKGKKHEQVITFSGGVTQVKDSEHMEEAIKRADKYLYKAKKNGRNNVVFDDKD